MTIACPDCGTLAEIPPLPPRSTAVCRLCRRDLEKTSGRSIVAALACSLGTFLLLIPANTLPLLRIDLMGLQAQNVIGGGIAALWREQWFLISGCTALFVIILPFVIFGLLSAVLACVRFGFRPGWLAAAFRWSSWLDLWGMPDVFLLASFVGYYRLSHLGAASVFIGPGGYCFIAAGFLAMLTRAALDRRTVWRVLGPAYDLPPGPDTLSCITCDLVQPLSREGEPCLRCGARLRPRKQDAMPRTAALLASALVLFIPANLLPMNVSNQLGNEVSYTIYTGIHELFENGLWPLGGLVFCTSILIPFGKILALGWCVMSVWRHSSARLVAKTKIFRLVAELGRWSKTDPFTIVFFVPLVNFGGLASSSAGWGATAFMVMSVLTMFASATFDPRLMWDVVPMGGA
ncbi:MAG TPA: paraquat-inducible protein A [Stellaceae bacterium]|nr:paraquat-inducible protein A [Stellaceae bacterium]